MSGNPAQDRRLAQGISLAPREAGPGVAAVIALGSNQGDRQATLTSAIEALGRLPLSRDLRVSAPIESVALTERGEDAAAPGYLNAVAIVLTRLAPSVLLGYLQMIENEHGRVRRERWGDRTLDLDLISYGETRSSDPELTLPHPHAAERDFVLRPWLSIDPDAVLPGVGRVDTLLRERHE